MEYRHHRLHVPRQLPALLHTLSNTQAYAALGWLVILHGAFWGAARADAVVRTSGLQAQGCLWDLDARPEELERIPETGWTSRLRHAARGVDMRLKADRCQTIVHGDAKAENMLLETFLKKQHYRIMFSKVST